MDMKIISLYLFSEMQNQDVTYDSLSEKTGIPKSSLQRYLTGERELPMDRFKAICDALGLNAVHVAGWEKPDDEENELNKQIIQILSEIDPAEKALAIEVLKRFSSRKG